MTRFGLVAIGSITKILWLLAGAGHIIQMLDLVGK